MKRLIIVVTFFACAGRPPQSLAPRAGMEVNAPFGRTWDAVVDVFATKNIPIKTMDRSSGFIATEEMRSGMYTSPDPLPYADCGRSAMKKYPAPTHANYNIRVKGDSTRSTVLVSVFWKQTEGVFTCTSKGVWESETENEIKARAESK